MDPVPVLCAAVSHARQRPVSGAERDALAGVVQAARFPSAEAVLRACVRRPWADTGVYIRNAPVGREELAVVVSKHLPLTAFWGTNTFFADADARPVVPVAALAWVAGRLIEYRTGVTGYEEKRKLIAEPTDDVTLFS